MNYLLIFTFFNLKNLNLKVMIKVNIVFDSLFLIKTANS